MAIVHWVGRLQFQTSVASSLASMFVQSWSILKPCLFWQIHKADIVLSATTAGKIFPIYPGPIYCDENGGKLGYETAEDGNRPL